MTTWLMLYGVPGAYSVSDPLIAGVTVLKVKTEGLGYDIIRTGTAGNRQVRHTVIAGQLTFLNPFVGDPANDLVQQLVYVLYKT